MSYEPKEGIDYIVDLYAVAGIPPETTTEELKTALNQRLMEYHPDRLEGLAPEFQEKGERMARLLNRARSVLLDVEKRDEYDQLLQEWTGPVSTSGIPVISMETYLRREMETKEPEEIEAMFGEQQRQIEAAVGYSENRLIFLDKMMLAAGDDAPSDLREQYEEALLSQDRALAIEEAERSRLLGIEDIANRRYEVSLEYGNRVTNEIESARKERIDELHALAAGGFAVRLALLAGEEVSPSMVMSYSASQDLPAYFDQLASRVQEIATTREDILDKRLKNFEPTYPEAELQSQPRETFILGIAGGESNVWIGMRYNKDVDSVDSYELAANVREQLDSNDFSTVIEGGVSVLLFELLEQIDVHVLISAAAEKHVRRLKKEQDS